jgi:hypothetical protein
MSILVLSFMPSSHNILRATSCGLYHTLRVVVMLFVWSSRSSCDSSCLSAGGIALYCYQEVERAIEAESSSVIYYNIRFWERTPFPFHKGRASWSASRVLMPEARTASAARRRLHRIIQQNPTLLILLFSLLRRRSRLSRFCSRVLRRTPRLLRLRSTASRR